MSLENNMITKFEIYGKEKEDFPHWTYIRTITSSNSGVVHREMLRISDSSNWKVFKTQEITVIE